MPRNRLSVDQPEIRFVDEGRRLQTVPHAFSRHASSRDAVEFLVDERDQSLEGALVAPTPFEQQPGDPRVGIRNPAILGHLVSCSLPVSSRPRSSTFPAMFPALFRFSPPNRALRVRGVFATTGAQHAHLRDRVVGWTAGPGGTTLQAGDIVRRTSSDPGRALLTGFVGGPAPRRFGKSSTCPDSGHQQDRAVLSSTTAPPRLKRCSITTTRCSGARGQLRAGRCGTADRDDRRSALRSTAASGGACGAAAYLKQL